MDTVNGKLFERIAAVMTAVRKLPQDGYNSHDKYVYTTAATAIEHIGRAMAENGVVVIPMIAHEATEKPNGSKAYYSTVEIDFNICDTDGNTFVSRWVGQGVNYRTPDKALKTAITNAETTFLLKLFLVGAGDDDPELDSQMEPASKGNSAPARPEALQENGKQDGTQITSTQLKRLQALGNQLYGKAGWSDKRQELVQFVTDGREMSSAELTKEEAAQLITGLDEKVKEAQKQLEQTPSFTNKEVA